MYGGATPALAADDGADDARARDLPARVVALADPGTVASLASWGLDAPVFAVLAADEPAEALELARGSDPALVLVDLASVGSSGFEFCRRLRTFSVAYIVLMAGRNGEADRRIGLSAGVDEYVDRHSSPRDVVQRIRAMLSGIIAAALPPASTVCHRGGLTVDLHAGTVVLDGARITLTPTEFALLATLVVHAGRPVARAELLRLVWGTTWAREDHLIDVHVSNLRAKLGDTPTRARYVRTVRRLGYQIGEELAPVDGQAS